MAGRAGRASAPDTDSRRRCADCGRDRVEVNYDRDGRWLCLRCYLEAHVDDPLVPELPAPTRQPRARDARTDWQRFRDAVHDALWDHAAFSWSIGFSEPPDGWDGKFRGRMEDGFIGTCPTCSYPVSVRWFGEALRVELMCWGGCSEAEIVACVRGLRVK